MGRRFGWLWASFAVSTFGACLAFDAFTLIAVLVLHAGPVEVSALAAVGRAVGAVVAVPLGPWVEFRRKRPVMVATDLVRFAAVASVPVAHLAGWLGFGQLVVVSVVVAASDIAFRAASGAYLKSLVGKEDLLIANGRFEATTWTATALGPPLGGLAVGVFGPVVTVAANAASYLLSAIGIRAIGGAEPPPARAGERLRVGDLLEGWRHVLRHPTLRPLFGNTLLVNGLIMAIAPPVALLMLGPLGFSAWEYGLAFGLPCLGGLVGARLARPLVARFGAHRVLRVAGTLRACWSLGLAFVGPGPGGLVLVLVVQFGLVTCVGVFNPVFATHRLERTGADRVARTLAAWSVTSALTTAALTALWGVLAAMVGVREAVLTAGILLLATPFLLPRADPVPEPDFARRH
ncbi:MFS transporter [Actinosynnema sp. NPDC047251]|uniref:Transmembrane efflux protein n=1 Tax=Saccharothrix espanaensis (strain ATCC 51144 / DSM 44229 / JCM 9112 / NBRC 15066 / NRRL 15764) TaxID=1179773 RepID=K0K5A4_SACES|nr:MFS transporter [Saccharothrix espanaensis]CCH31718.1 Transmembrane efflux protein [Saccharothrix espanaensis DSM 44229]